MARVEILLDLFKVVHETLRHEGYADLAERLSAYLPADKAVSEPVPAAMFDLSCIEVEAGLLEEVVGVLLGNGYHHWAADVANAIRAKDSSTS